MGGKGRGRRVGRVHERDPFAAAGERQCERGRGRRATDAALTGDEQHRGGGDVSVGSGRFGHTRVCLPDPSAAVMRSVRVVFRRVCPA